MPLWLEMLVMLELTFALGLAIGWVTWNREG
jgi:hypothetical protein